MKPTPSNLAPGLHTVPEIPTPTPIPLTGTLPPYLHNSTLYRNGPGRYSATFSTGETYTMTHWFDGFALVHAFRLDALNQTVTYHNKFTSAGYIRAIKATPQADYFSYIFARSDPCRQALGAQFQMLRKEPVDPLTKKPAYNLPVTFQPIPGKGRLVARTDSTSCAVLDKETLEVDHFFDFSTLCRELAGPFSAAHGHFDEERGEFINYNFEAVDGSKQTYRVFAIGEGRETTILGRFEEFPAYLHSFATTERFVVICVWPSRLDGGKIMQNQSVLDGLTFEKVPVVFYVISREEKKVVAKYESDPFFCLHTANAFERDDAIHIDLSRYDDTAVLDRVAIEELRTNGTLPPSSLTRFSLQRLSEAIAAGPDVVQKATETVVNDMPLEFPSVHPDLLRKEHRYIYGVTDEDGFSMNAVAKIDVVTGKRVVWTVEKGVAGEPIFVNNPEGEDEDDGVLLVVVLDSVKEKSDLVVLDAKSMTEVAKASVPQTVPLGFHGMYAQS